MILCYYTNADTASHPLLLQGLGSQATELEEVVLVTFCDCQSMSGAWQSSQNAEKQSSKLSDVRTLLDESKALHTGHCAQGNLEACSRPKGVTASIHMAKTERKRDWGVPD